MRVAFDVRSEFQHLLGKLTWKQCQEHWLAVELLRGYRTLIATPGRIWRGIDIARVLRAVRRRVLWMCPRVPPGLLRRFSGFVLMCVLIGTAMRMWPRDGATAAVAPTILNNAPRSLQAGPSEPGSSNNQVRPEAPNSTPPRPRPIDELAQRKAALVKAQQACMERVARTESYQSAKSKFDELDVKVRELREKDPYRELPRLSIQWIEAKSDLKKVIDEAMNADPEVVRAQTALKQPKRFR